MLHALVLAVGQLSDPGSRRVVWIGLLAAVAGFILTGAAAGYLLSHTALTQIGWVDTAIDLLGGLFVILIAWMLFPATVVTVSSFLLDEVVDRVEARHYPYLTPAPRLPFKEELVNAVRLFALVAAVNLLALPLYLAAPGLNLLVYYALNGYLLGREYFGLVANRRLGSREAAVLRRSHPLRPFLGGLAIAFLSTVPVINLLLPVVGSALMVHVFHGMSGRLRPAG